MMEHITSVTDYIKEHWQWILGTGVPTILAIRFRTEVKMWYKKLYPIRIKVFEAKFGFRNLIAGYLDNGTPITLLWADELEGYFSITLIRRPRLDEFHEFYLEIPKLNKTISGDAATLSICDHSPQKIEFSAGLLTKSQQQDWQAKLVKGTEIFIKVKAGWRHRWPVTKKVRLSEVNL